MAHSNEQSLKQVINELLSAYKLDKKLYQIKLINSWETVMGKAIAKHTTEIFIQKKTLFVKLDSAALKQELSYSKTKLIQILNEEAKHEVIDEILFM